VSGYIRWSGFVVSGYIRGAAFVGSGYIRGAAFVGSGYIRGTAFVGRRPLCHCLKCGLQRGGNYCISEIKNIFILYNGLLMLNACYLMTDSLFFFWLYPTDIPNFSDLSWATHLQYNTGHHSKAWER
jgi:hypothetical protein